jgi:hypothetical protein
MENDNVSQEATIGRDQPPPDPDYAVGEIKDYALMLGIAGKHLGEDVILKRIGEKIERSVSVLRTYVADLKRQVVGKPTREVDFEEPFDNLDRLAEELRDSDEKTNDRCASGTLGAEAWEKFSLLVRNINTLKQKLTGRPVSYGRSDFLRNVFSPLFSLLRSVFAVFSAIARLAFVCGMICLALFGYLLLTMETTEDLEGRIAQNRASIQLKRAGLDKVRDEMTQVQQEIDSLSGLELSRGDKIDIMALKVKAHNLSEELNKIQVELDLSEKNLKGSQSHMEALKQKSFLQRILRQ